MFRKFFKKDSTSNEENLSGGPNTISQEQQEEPTEYLPHEGDAMVGQPMDIVDEEVETLIPDEPIQDDDFDAVLDLEDVGMVDDIDEEAMREELQQAIAEELMSEENLEAVEARADAMETELGITSAEWEETYNNPQFIGYEDRKQQAMVFQTVLPEEFDVFEDTILDVGCGIGDLWAYCTEVLECDEPLYTGIDVEQDIIEMAKKKFPEVANSFKVQDITTYNTNTKYDWVIAMSAFNVKIDTPNQTEYVRNIIKKMYDLSNKGIAINLMHSYPEGEDWSDDMVTFNSGEIFTWAIENYYNVKAHRNYIDRDFILYIYK